ncbi:MAG: hypothetical protein WAT74_18260 [Flavobacteriales bacterium]
MGLLQKLFGSKPRKTVEDDRFGVLFLLRGNGSNSVWSGKWDIGEDSLEFFVGGSDQAPSEEAIHGLEKIVSERVFLEQSKAAVIELLRNAAEGYEPEQFETDMALAAINVKGPGTFTISYVQRKEPGYHFTAEFVGGESVGVSIDS